MTKKKRRAKKVLGPLNEPAKLKGEGEIKPPKPKLGGGRCEMCSYFSLNGKGANRGSCHRYPTVLGKWITDWCGEFK